MLIHSMVRISEAVSIIIVWIEPYSEKQSSWKLNISKKSSVDDVSKYRIRIASIAPGVQWLLHNDNF